MKNLEHFLEKAEAILARLEPLLPPAVPEPDWHAIAFRWCKSGLAGWLEPIEKIHAFPVGKLTCIDRQIEAVMRNTRQFVKGKSANNVLLSGSRGTGKSSLIKSLLIEFADQGLRLIEIDRQDLTDLSRIVDLISGRKERFILFCDDLTFEQGDDGYKALKTALDGGLAQGAENLLVYATSNRRHLMPETMSDNLQYQKSEESELHPGEAIEEKISLSDRFGLWLTFYPFDQDDYLAAVKNWLAEYGLKLDEITHKAALQWALTRGNRSGRTALQFVCDWAGRTKKERQCI